MLYSWSLMWTFFQASAGLLMSVHVISVVFVSFAWVKYYILCYDSLSSHSKQIVFSHSSRILFVWCDVDEKVYSSNIITLTLSQIEQIGQKALFFCLVFIFRHCSLRCLKWCLEVCTTQLLVNCSFLHFHVGRTVFDSLSAQGRFRLQMSC